MQSMVYFSVVLHESVDAMLYMIPCSGLTSRTQERAAVTGGSAGGYTVLAALTRRSGVFTYVLRAKRRMRNSSSVCCRAVPGRATMACRRWKP